MSGSVDVNASMWSCLVQKRDGEGHKMVVSHSSVISCGDDTALVLLLFSYSYVPLMYSLYPYFFFFVASHYHSTGEVVSSHSQKDHG